jgi:CheY-like chemotaxis protein
VKDLPVKSVGADQAASVKGGDTLRAAVTEILPQDGATVTAVGSAEEALAAVQGERPDVLATEAAEASSTGAQSESPSGIRTLPG